MNKFSLAVALVLCFSSQLYAQVGIGTSSPDGTAILHLNSIAKGFLPPKLTTTQRNNINTPANGLLLYNTIESKLNIYSNTSWVAIPHSTTGAAGITLGLESGFTGQHYSALALGQSAGYNNQASDGISIGNYAGYDAQGSRSIAIGFSAGSLNQSTSSIAIGHAAGVDGQGSNSVAIGYLAGNSSQGAYAIAIGNKAATASQPSNSIVLNASSTQLDVTQSGLFVNPIRGVAATTPVLTYDPITKEVRYSTSDGRLKNNILPLPSGLAEIMRLQPVTYDFRESLQVTEYPGHATGFIAQQVREVLPELVIPVPGEDSLLAINTLAMVPILVKAIQELRVENKLLEAKLEQIALKSKKSKRLFGRHRN